MNLNSRYPTFRNFLLTMLMRFNALIEFNIPFNFIYTPCQFNKK